jgi:nucleoside-triphosphatase THEP1
MVLVAVTGPVGSGKTRLLASLAEWAGGNVKQVDGFIAVGRDRPIPEKGAREYVLQQLASRAQLPFARRDESQSPPYRIEQKSLDQLTTWAESLSSRHPLSLLIMDEFGPLEARGGGHASYWPLIAKAHPEVVVIAVRENVVREIETRLCLPFDVVIDATSPNATDTLQSLVLHHSDWIRVGQFGAAAGGFEATVGSALHQARIPMSGLFLSVVQSLVMMFAGDRLSDRSRILWVPFISAGLKALSPYGGRLRPMLAITVQGFLFSVSVTLLGWNVVGIFVGGWFVGFWAALQGIVLQYVIIGDNLFPALDIMIRWMAGHLHLELPGVVSLIVVWTLFSGAVSAIVTLIAWRRRHRLPARLSAMLAKGAGGIAKDARTPTMSNALKTGLRDLARPFFWAPVAAVALIIVATGSSWEQAMWLAVRAVTVGWVLFSLARLFDPRKLALWLQRKGHWGPAMALSRALRPQAGPPEEQPPAGPQ